MSNIHLANTLLCWNHRGPGRTTSVHGVLTPTLPSKTTLLLRPGKGFDGWVGGVERGKKGRKKNLKTIKHKPRLYLERSGCCIPIPDDLWDATEVPLKRERMREQLFSVTAHTAYHDFPSGRLGQDYHNLPPARPSSSLINSFLTWRTYDRADLQCCMSLRVRGSISR